MKTEPTDVYIVPSTRKICEIDLSKVPENPFKDGHFNNDKFRADSKAYNTALEQAKLQAEKEGEFEDQERVMQIMTDAQKFKANSKFDTLIWFKERFKPGIYSVVLPEREKVYQQRDRAIGKWIDIKKGWYEEFPGHRNYRIRIRFKASPNSEAEEKTFYTKEKIEEITNVGDLFGGLQNGEPEKESQEELWKEVASSYAFEYIPDQQRYLDIPAVMEQFTITRKP